MHTTVRSVLTLGAACVLGVAVGVLVNSSGLDREPVQQPPAAVVDSSPTPSPFAPEVTSTTEKAVEDPQPTHTRSATRPPAADQADDGKGDDNSGKGSDDNSGKGSDDSGKGSDNSGKGSDHDDDDTARDD
jgi:hypothetical protein